MIAPARNFNMDSIYNALKIYGYIFGIQIQFL